MNSPWLDVPLADYEGHMALPGIEQAHGRCAIKPRSAGYLYVGWSRPVVSSGGVMQPSSCVNDAGMAVCQWV